MLHARRHALAGQASIDLQLLRDETFVMFARDVAPANYDNVISCLHHSGIRPNTTHAARQWLTVAALVSAGQGVALVPRCVERAGIAGVGLRPAARCRRVRPLPTWLGARPRRSLLQAFVRSVQQQWPPPRALELQNPLVRRCFPCCTSVLLPFTLSRTTCLLVVSP